VLIVFIPFWANGETATDKVKEQYFSSLDHWVESGGNIDTVQKSVVENCGKLTMATASLSEKAQFITTDQEEFHFRVDVCVKMTVNRVHPQPEFEKSDIVNMICDGDTPFFQLLCLRSGLR